MDGWRCGSGKLAPRVVCLLANASLIAPDVHAAGLDASGSGDSLRCKQKLATLWSPSLRNSLCTVIT
eukprot:363625-Chlamydomonas_euryale.AAC.1